MTKKKAEEVKNWYETITPIETYDSYKAIRGFLKDKVEAKSRLKDREIDVADIEKLKYGVQLYHTEKKDIFKVGYQIFLKDGNKKMLHFSSAKANGIVDK